LKPGSGFLTFLDNFLARIFKKRSNPLLAFVKCAKSKSARPDKKDEVPRSLELLLVITGLNDNQRYLRLLFRDWGVIGWLIRHWPYVTIRQITLTELLEQSPARFSVEKLQASRVVQVPYDKEIFIAAVGMLCESSMRDFISQSLEKIAVQTSLSVEDFCGVVCKLIRLDNIRILQNRRAP
jgi:hypothetical protein